MIRQEQWNPVVDGSSVCYLPPVRDRHDPCDTTPVQGGTLFVSVRLIFDLYPSQKLPLWSPV